MATRVIKKGEWKMSEQLDFFGNRESYNLNNLRKLCRDEVKKKFPAAVDGEDYIEYLNFIADESDLLFCERIRQIADDIENRILGTQKEVIREVYGYAIGSNSKRK